MKPVCITMGDPAGVGPELIIRLLNQLNFSKSPALLLIGDRAILEYALEKFGDRYAKFWFNHPKIFDQNQKRIIPDAKLNILSLSQISPKKIQIERGSAKHGKASWKYIEAGVKLCRSGI